MSNSKNTPSAIAKRAWKTRRKLYGPTGTPTKTKGNKKITTKRKSASGKIVYENGGFVYKTSTKTAFKSVTKNKDGSSTFSTLTPAQKGAVTRRKNANFAKRSAAAKKAWKTIRANKAKNINKNG